MLKIITVPGADPGFQARGGHLKKNAPSGGRHEHFWGISLFLIKKLFIFLKGPMPCSGGHLAFSDRHKKHKFCKGPCKEHLTKFAIRSFGGFR